jgi:hypothetical protein
MSQYSCALLLSVLLCGCASYLTPGAGVSIPEITTPAVAEAMSRKPAATFPARLVIVRVQGAGYQSYTSHGYGRGNYSVITTRDIETEADFTRLAAMPEVVDVGGVNRLLVPAVLNSADDLRQAAAALQADIVLMYTIDTAFRTETQQIGPMQLVSLGFFPNKKAKVASTCALAFIDTRTGFIYGVAESTASEEQRSDMWNKEEAIEKARAKAERAAFTAALAEAEKLWGSITARYGGKPVGGASNTIPAAP